MNQSARTPFEWIGGEAGVRLLVDRFYHLMDSDPEAAGIRALHPPDLAGSREKLWLFLVGWLGGPPLYVERHGHPRLRARHLPFPIGDAERDAWMRCMNQALDEHSMPDMLREQMRERLGSVADHMRNRPEGGLETPPDRG